MILLNTLIRKNKSEYIMKYYKILCSIFVILILACSGSKNLNMDNLQKYHAVKIIFRDGHADNGIITDKNGENITYISEADHVSREVKREEILRFEKLGRTYDLLAYPISTAEVEKYKQNRNTWGYALGGAVIGGAAGLVVGLPFWYADVGGIPPYFTAGAGAVIGSIYFAFRGQDKDKQEAIRKIRYFRQHEKKLENQVEKEKQQLQKIEDEKRKLKEELKKKK